MHKNKYNEIFEKNLEILNSLLPDFKDQVASQYSPDPEMQIFNSYAATEDEDPLPLPTAAWKGIALHSKHNPVREGYRLAAELGVIKNKNSSADDGRQATAPVGVLFYGFGLGYVVEGFLKQYDHLEAVIIEPSIPRFLKALQARDLSFILTSPCITLLLEAAPPQIEVFLKSFPKGELQVSKVRSLLEMDPDYFLQIDDIVRRRQQRIQVNQATLKRFGNIWVRNLIKNTPAIARSGNVGVLGNLFASLPVLLAAGGPSLDNLLPHMKEIAKRCIIVAVDTSAGAILQGGVKPDFLVVVDPQYWNTRHLDSFYQTLKQKALSPDWDSTNGYDLSTFIISESSTHPRIFSLLKEFPLFFCGSLFPLGRYIEQFLGSRRLLGAGGSVATTAWDFCRFIGGNPIYCIGLDLGFPGLNTHFKGSFFEERMHLGAGRLNPAATAAFTYIYEAAPFRAKNNCGTTTLTDQRLLLYKDWFQEQVQKHDNNDTRTLSRDGIAIPGIKPALLDELTALPIIRPEIDRVKNDILEGGEYMQSDGPEDSMYIPAPAAIHKTSSALAAGLDTLLYEFKTLSRLARQALDLVITLETSYSCRETTRAIEGLSQIDRQILGLQSKEIAGFLLQPLLEATTLYHEKAFNGHHAAADKKPSGPASKNNNAEEIIDRSRQLYTGIVESTAFHIELLETYKNRSF